MVIAGPGGGCGGSGGLGKMNLIIHVITGSWFMVFASLLIMSTAGATYMFGLYSSDIKSALGYDQTTLNLLSFFKDLGTNVGILSGLINEVTPPWVVLLIGRDEAMKWFEGAIALPLLSLEKFPLVLIFCLNSLYLPLIK